MCFISIDQKKDNHQSTNDQGAVRHRLQAMVEIRAMASTPCPPIYSRDGKHSYQKPGRRTPQVLRIYNRLVLYDY